jgi:Fic family protein
MVWNWQKVDWPNFRWDAALLRKAEERFLLNGGEFSGTVKHLADADREQLAVDAISTEALTTSEIEGEILDRESVQSSIRRQFGLDTDNRIVKPAEQGVAEMMVDLHRSFAAPLSDGTLFSWHRMLMRGRRDLRQVGQYRSDAEPMQVVSGALYEPEVHFEAPPSADVPGEMARFVKWFHQTAPWGKEPLPALTRAGIAHLYFESIHPFEDGNGRIGRAISEMALAQALGRPTLTALAATILLRRKGYYRALEAANRDNEITSWLRWFAGVTLEAQLRSAARLAFLLDKTRLLDRMRGLLNKRQERVLLRMLREGPEGFKGGLSAANYAKISGAPSATVTRDLADLVTNGALARTGERRYTRYFLTIPLPAVPSIEIDPKGEVVERI